MQQHYLKVLDIGHNGKSPDEAMMILETTVSQCSFEDKIKAIKVITGHGSGKLRKIVRAWCNDQEGRFNKVIYGEDYDMFNRDAVEMRSEFLTSNDEDFNRRNPGITIIWL